MIVITYATHVDGYMPILEDQCIKLNLNLVVLGMNKKWEGFFQRTLDYYDYLKSLKENEICIFIDGFDTLAMEDEKMILDKYKNFNKPIVWSVDLSRNFIGKLIFGSEEVLVNGGCYMGRVTELKELFGILINKYGNDKKLDDQIIINKFYLKNRDYFDKIIALDMKSIIFANINYKLNIYYVLNNSAINIINTITFNTLLDTPENLLDYEYDNKTGKIICIETKVIPSFISGPACTDMDPLVNKLGYDFKNTRHEHYWENNVIYKQIKDNVICVSILLVFILYFVIISRKNKKNINL